MPAAGMATSSGRAAAHPGSLDAAGSPVLFLSGAGIPSWIWYDVRVALPDSVGNVGPWSCRDPTTRATANGWRDRLLRRGGSG